MAPAGYGKTTLAMSGQQSVLPSPGYRWAKERTTWSATLSVRRPERGRPRRGGYARVRLGTNAEKDSVLAASHQSEASAMSIRLCAGRLSSIDEPSVLAALAFLLDPSPPALHFVLSGRGEFGYPWRALSGAPAAPEIRQRICASRGTRTRFLDHFMGPVLGREDADGLHQQTGGWIAGLQLAALSLRHHNERLADRPVVSGRQRFIADYLSDDVLAPLPQTMREFLLQTSILERLCAPLCAAVTGYKASQAMLEKLEGESLFLTPLDDSRKWFRYHPLFAEFLQARLEQRNPEEVKTLHRVAARWHLDEELPEQAFEHAVAGDDAGCAIEVIERYLGIKLTGGEFRQVQAWLDALPEQWLVDYPVINVARAALFAYTGAVEQCIRCLDDAEEEFAVREETRARERNYGDCRCLLPERSGAG